MIKLQIKKLLQDRERDGLPATLYWLSQATGIRWATISSMVDGKARRIDLSQIDALCHAFQCAPGDLFVREASRKTLTAREIKKLAERLPASQRITASREQLPPGAVLTRKQLPPGDIKVAHRRIAVGKVTRGQYRKKGK